MNRYEILLGKKQEQYCSVPVHRPDYMIPDGYEIEQLAFQVDVDDYHLFNRFDVNVNVVGDAVRMAMDQLMDLVKKRVEIQNHKNECTRQHVVQASISVLKKSGVTTLNGY